MNDTLQSQKARLEQISQELISINDFINAFKRNLDDLSKKYSELESIKGLESKVDDATKGYLQGHIILKKKSELLDLANSAMQANNSDMIKALSSLSSKHESIEERFLDYKNDQELKAQTLRNDHKKALEALRKEFQASLDSLRKDLVVSPSDVFQQNNDVMKKLESTALDGSNAMMKVNNIDLHTRILEKRIENLAIQIKRIELSQAG
jgi:septation ring formation regulator EzrA